MKKLLSVIGSSLILLGCVSHDSFQQTDAGSHMVGRKIMDTYNPLPEGEYAQFYEWGRDYARMYQELNRCSNRNVLTGRFIKRIKLSAMVLGKDNYNDIMFAMRDQANQVSELIQRMDNRQVNEYFGPLPDNTCTELQNTANYMVFDTLDYGIKWREINNQPVKLSDWKVYPIFASNLGDVVFDEEGFVKRDLYGNVLFTTK